MTVFKKVFNCKLLINNMFYNIFLYVYELQLNRYLNANNFELFKLNQIMQYTSYTQNFVLEKEKLYYIIT